MYMYIYVYVYMQMFLTYRHIYIYFCTPYQLVFHNCFEHMLGVSLSESFSGESLAVFGGSLEPEFHRCHYCKHHGFPGYTTSCVYGTLQFGGVMASCMTHANLRVTSPSHHTHTQEIRPY